MRDELRTDMRDGFKKVDDQFKKVDDEFANVRTEVRDGFKKVDDQFKKVDDEFSKVRAEIRAEGETTRRHFDIVAESLRESMKIIAEGHAHNSARLDNHETRLTRLERPRRG